MDVAQLDAMHYEVQVPLLEYQHQRTHQFLQIH